MKIDVWRRSDARHHQTIVYWQLAVLFGRRACNRGTAIMFYVGLFPNTLSPPSLRRFSRNFAKRRTFVVNRKSTLHISLRAFPIFGDFFGHRIKFLQYRLAVKFYNSKTVAYNTDWLSWIRLSVPVQLIPAKTRLQNVLSVSLNSTHLVCCCCNWTWLLHCSAILYQEQRRYDEAIDSYKMAVQCRPRLTSKQALLHCLIITSANTFSVYF